MKIVLANQFKNEGLRLVEWLEYYRDRGITDFVLCNDNSTDDSVEKIRSVKGINCLVMDSIVPPSHFHSSKDTDAYAGNCAVAVSISTNFKRIHRRVLDMHGKETLLGFFDVDEFLVGKTRELHKEIVDCSSDYLMTSLWSFEVDSDMFNLTLDKHILSQTTRTMGTKNRSICTRKSVFKSILNLLRDKDNLFCSFDPSICGGCYAHGGGVDRALAFGVAPYRGYADPNHDPAIPVNDSDEWISPFRNWRLVAPNLMKFLHYRKPTYDHSSNKNLFDVDCLVP